MKPDLKVGDLKANPRNPRKITDEKAAMLARALAEFGDLSGIVYNRLTDRLVGGHQRVKQLPKDAEIVVERRFTIATKTGTIAEGHVLVEGERYSYREVVWDEDREKAANIAANKHGGEFDLPLLNEFLLELDAVNYDLDLTGFTAKELEDLLAPIEKVDPQEDEDTVYEPPAEPIVKPGDLFVLGNHRLLCGDSTNLQHVERLLGGERAAMVVTDPPYNVNYGGDKNPAWGHKGKDRTIMNDKMSAEDFREFCRGFISSIVASTAGCVYVFGPPGPDGRIMFSECDAAMHCSTTIIWNKDRLVLGRGKYHTKYEPCWFGWVSSGANFTKDRTLTNVWDCKRPGVSELHPTMKPVELIETCIQHASQERDVVLDLFGGSGTTMIACEKQGRFARLMELDPKYAQVIVNRWCGFTGKEAFLVAGDGSLVPWSDVKAGAPVPEGDGHGDDQQDVEAPAEA